MAQNEQVKNYCDFMYDRSNEYDCFNCPENCGFQGQNQYPCGQYRCWVTAHCNSRRDEDDDDDYDE